MSRLGYLYLRLQGSWLNRRRASGLAGVDQKSARDEQGWSGSHRTLDLPFSHQVPPLRSQYVLVRVPIREVRSVCSPAAIRHFLFVSHEAAIERSTTVVIRSPRSSRVDASLMLFLRWLCLWPSTSKPLRLNPGVLSLKRNDVDHSRAHLLTLSCSRVSPKKPCGRFIVALALETLPLCRAPSGPS